MAALLLCACASNSAAQISGTLSAQSDYRYRGSSLSDGKPAVQGGLAYDDPHGWYAGAFASTIKLRPPGGTASHLQTIVYGGYAKRVAAGINIEAGGDYAAFADASDLNYGEAYIGINTDALNARFYYSPHYFGGSSQSIYGEINATQPLIDRMRLHLHAGFFRYRYESSYGVMFGGDPIQRVIDGRIGLRFDLDPFQLEVAWVGVSNHAAAYLIAGRSSPNTVVATVSLSF